MNNNRKRILFRWVKIIVLLYALTGIALFYLQDFILFHPTVIDRNVPYTFEMPFEEVDLAMNETDTINLVKFFPKDSLRKGVVLYFHGNKGNINRFVKYVNNFTKNGYEVWVEDYPGFGKSIGVRNEKILYRQAEQVYTLAATKYSKDSIIIYGKSFGTGIAAYLAAVKDCKQLILETPYYSIPALFDTYAPIYPNSRMANYKMPTFEYLQDLKIPVTIFHGTDDGVIRYSCAAKLRAVLKSTDQFITIDGGSHNNLNDFPLYHRVLDSLLQLR
jgi:alpha-beta hydrolase superfamily lysophospholipase